MGPVALYILCVIFITIFVIITHAILNVVFDGNYVFIQALLEFCINVICGLYFGRFVSRKLFYIHIKNLYKKQEQTTKGE